MSTKSLVTRLDNSIRVAVGVCTKYVMQGAREVASETGRPVIVIASRRQVESRDFGGGYVGLGTPEWCDDVSADTADGMIILARDHGGPYQHPSEMELSEAEAMSSALDSLRGDIECGVEMLHIDTGTGKDGPASVDYAMTAALELVAECTTIARNLRRTVGFEIGVEVQDYRMSTVAEFEEGVGSLLREIRDSIGIIPQFVVAQTGTLVSGWRNKGVLADPRTRVESSEGLRLLSGAARAAGSRLKAHNCDYLERYAVRYLGENDAWVNISPEVGFAQTKAILHASRLAGLGRELDDFCQATIDSGRWRKWVPRDQDGESMSDEGKILLGGSYLFSTECFSELCEHLDHALKSEGSSSKRVAIESIKSVIYYYHGGLGR